MSRVNRAVLNELLRPPGIELPILKELHMYRAVLNELSK